MALWYKVGDFFIDFRSSNYQILLPLEAAELTIKSIVQHYPPPYHLMVSGGVDSQAMLFAWKMYGSNYIPTSIYYDDWLNIGDLHSLFEFSQQQKIEVNYKQFKLVDFYNFTYTSVVEKYQCTSPQIGAYIGMTQDLPGTVIFSGNLIFRNEVPFDHVQRSLIRYSLDKPVVPFFFWQSPEITYSILSTKERKNIRLQNITSYEKKVLDYQKNGFEVISQNKNTNHMTGFNGVKDYYDRNFKHLITPRHILGAARFESRRVHDMLLRYPHVNRIGNPKYVQYFNE